MRDAGIVTLQHKAIRIAGPLLFILAAYTASAQQGNIPLSAWRMHISYNRIHSIAISPQHIYAAAPMGVVTVDRADENLSVYNRLNGLSAGKITALGYHPETDQLLIAYHDGNVDFIKDNEVRNFSRLKDLNTIPGSKRINHIAFHGNFAYLATDYGVAVFDLQNDELRETWRDLGKNGEKVAVRKSVFKGDSIFVSVENEILAGDLADNLLDYSKWKRYSPAGLSGAVAAIAIYEDQLYAAIPGAGLQVRNGSGFANTGAFTNAEFTSLESNEDDLVVATAEGVFVYKTPEDITAVTSELITLPLSVVKDSSGTLWIGDSSNGLVSDISGALVSYIPNGPGLSRAARLVSDNGILFALPGARDVGSQSYSSFVNGLWATSATSVRAPSDAQASGESLYVASLGDGLLLRSPTGEMVFDASNSPLSGPDPDNIHVTDLQRSPQGLWVANYNSAVPLHLVTGTSFQSFQPAYSQATFPQKIAVDDSGIVWIAVDPSRGGGLVTFDPQTSQTSLLISAPGSGDLPHMNVRSLDVDRDGVVWIGTDAGVAYFTAPDQDAGRPIFESRFLLKDETITAIATDGGNRKWMGTRRGAWLFSPAGDELVYNFTTANSPLLSDTIDDIAIDHRTGEVFFATMNGIVSFRSDATITGPSDTGIRIFPNPITARFSGLVGISGLASDAVVKITDVNGRLISEVHANGGTASWNVRDLAGRRPATGIYLVFAALADGSEKMVGKIAIVE